MYWARGMNRRSNEIGQRLGWITDSTSRMPMLDDLAAAVRNGQLEVPSRDLVREMVTFVVWENGKPMAEEGTHDDRVIALAIAYQMGTREHRHGGTSSYTGWEAADTQSGN
jgi:phage terminase large subunit